MSRLTLVEAITSSWRFFCSTVRCNDSHEKCMNAQREPHIPHTLLSRLLLAYTDKANYAVTVVRADEM